MNDNSDYNKPRVNMYDFLPETYKSDANRSIFENLFNRFLTKQETEKVSGYIGEGNPEAIIKRQIQEPTVHRQGYQLQPILYNKIGSIEWMSSWYDLLNEADRMGIDREKMQEWLDLLKFNWAPPIDLDKFIHFADYYWYDPENPNGKPQYLTIRSRCETATAFANFQQSLVDDYGATIPTIRAKAVDGGFPTYSIVDIFSTSDTIVVSGDLTNEINNQQYFELIGTLFNNNKYQLTAPVVYNLSTDRTTITLPPGSIITDEAGIGSIQLLRYDGLIINNEFIRLFDEGFVFMYKNSSNFELDGSFWKVIEAEYDGTNNETIITINTVFTDSVVNGVISQEETLASAFADRDCQCSGSVGWDSFQWDDNPETPIWDGNFSSLIVMISNTVPPTAAGTPGELWWDETGDVLYQYSSTLSTWKQIWGNFSSLLETTSGTGFWEFTPGCGINSIVESADQWVDQNRWVHKSDVPNFSSAKQAQLPIIEYEWDLELNEWNVTEHQWKYRVDNFGTFELTDTKPSLLELIPLLDWNNIGEEIVLDEKYGDLTEYFIAGRQFMGVGVPEIFEVEYSRFRSDVAGEPLHTTIKMTVPVSTSGLVPFITPLRPLNTSTGDVWRGHNIHWVYVGQKEVFPIPHQPQNKLTEIANNSPIIPHISGDYNYTFTYYAQATTILAEKNLPLFAGVSQIELTNDPLPGTSFFLRGRAMIGFDDIRVYVNGIRQYGNYEELSEVDLGLGGDTTFVSGINFTSGHELDKFDIVIIEVGEASTNDIGSFSVPVRMVEDNIDYASTGNILVSLVEYRKSEQVKSETNQYPLFDIFNMDGSPAFRASNIFGYQTSTESRVYPEIGLRLVTDTSDVDYVFEQSIVDTDGTMFAYRDYNNKQNEYWFNTKTDTVMFWDGFSWSNRTYSGTDYTKAIVSDLEPSIPFINIDMLYWFDTLNNELKVRNNTLNLWTVVTDVIQVDDDHTLQSIWKHGLNKELNQPEKRDWEKRSLVEYTEQKELFVKETSEELINQGSTIIEAAVEADESWATKQSNHLSLNGDWVGDWEIPDPLYYNVANENRKTVSFRELLTHFDTIIKSQPKLPGFNGPLENMYRLIPINEINFALGGKIRLYNHGFDIFLSTLFTNEVSPREIISFAHDQYEVILNNLRELYRKSASELLLDISDESLENQSLFIAEQIIEKHEESDLLNTLYGDSTTFLEVDGTGDIGIRNWIATLPFFGLADKFTPTSSIDQKLEINELLHHDGHRNNYAFEDGVREGIIFTTISTPDPRTAFPSPSDPPIDTFGKIAQNSPPNNSDEFSNEFATSFINREGVYWYDTSNTLDRIFYRLNVISVSILEPSTTVADGTLWVDIDPGLEVLRIKQTNPITGNESWEIVPGMVQGESPIRLHNGTNPADINTSSISAWNVVNLDEHLMDTVLIAETKLTENIPEYKQFKYDFAQLRSDNIENYDALLNKAFLDYVNESEISTPFKNDGFSTTDPFTWNYKYSSPGQSYDISGVDLVANAFLISTDVTAAFTLNQQFYIKNSGSNDGNWTTHPTQPAVYNAPFTIVYVDGSRTADDNDLGSVYTGLLPSPFNQALLPFNINDGSESGGYWRDYYQKLYNTPYPHLEPWSLQGYGEKPSWWDDEYLNDNPIKWGQRRWKYKHGFEITGLNQLDDYFEFDGDFREVLTPGQNFAIDGTTPTDHDGIWKVGTFSSITNTNTGVAGTVTLEIPTDHTLTFTPGYKFAVTDTLGNITQLLTTVGSVFSGPPFLHTFVTVAEEVLSATGFDNISGVSFDPLSNHSVIRIDTTAVGIKNDVTSPLISGRILVHYGMWENIRVGIIPAGREYPNGTVSITGNPTTDNGIYNIPIEPFPTFNYFSVNIGNFTTSDGYTPDDVFPPYWDYVSHFGTSLPPTFDFPIRSVMTFFSEIRTPGVDFAFGDAGIVEWEWRNSSQYLYDQLTVAFQLDPIRFTYDTFGVNFHTVGGLLVNENTNKVLSHTDTQFYGDIKDNETLKFNGLNQWYVNYTRYIGLDVSMSDMRSQWTNWSVPLTYQFASFVDTASLDVAHRNVCVSNFDYDIISKRSAGVEDFWLDSFAVRTINIPPKIVRYDNDNDWEFELTTPSSHNEIEYFDVKNYQFLPDTTTNICSLYTWNLVNVNSFDNTFSVPGNQTEFFIMDRTLDIINSTSNDNTYTVLSSVFNSISNETIILVETNSSITNIVDGQVKLNYRTFDLNTGDRVILSTHQTLPVPLEGDNINGIFTYFVIATDTTHFQLALTESDAYLGNAIDIQTTGTEDSFVGQLSATFNTDKTNNIWKHYTVDINNTLVTSFPNTVHGLQSIINLVDGYAKKLEDAGWRINSDNSLLDPGSSAFVSWHQELRRLIDFNFGLRDTKRQVKDKFETTVDIVTDIWTFEGNTSSQMITGDPVSIFVTDNLYPAPLIRGGRYYMIRDTFDTFRLAATRADAESGTSINITSFTGASVMYVASASNLRNDRPTHEVNAFREGIWFRPERGIVSNLITGPTSNIFNSQLLLDQYGRALGTDDTRIFREDKETHINIAGEIANDIEPFTIFNDPYRYLHLGSSHLFVDTYEHVLKFNNETTEGQLIYDPFVGLNVTKFEALFNRQTEFTQRPNVGGQYLQTFFNQGADLNRNIEASVEDLRLIYDTYQTNESNTLTINSRESLGYDGREDYLDNVNVNAKSQFAFWRGQIQNKGSLNTVNAFVNSRRFIDAKLDEFWAFKVADFGSALENEYISMWINTVDARSNELRLEFTDDSNICYSGFAINDFSTDCGYSFPSTGELVLTDDTFSAISLSDNDRWFNQPNQLERLRNNGGTLYFDLKPYSTVNIHINEKPPISNGIGWVDSSMSPSVFYRWNEDKFVEYNVLNVLLPNQLEFVGTVPFELNQLVELQGSTHDDRTYTITSIIVGATTIITVDRDLTTIESNLIIKAWGIWDSHGKWDTGSPTTLPVIRHNMKADFIKVTLDYDIALSGSPPVMSSTEVFEMDVPISITPVNDLTIPSYIPLTGSLSVFKDGIQLVGEGIDFLELFDENVLLSSVVRFREDISGTKISVVYSSSTLVEDLHFENINTNIIRFIFPELLDMSVNDQNVKIWGYTYDKDSQNPAKLIDKKSEVVITTIPYWDPARNCHYHNGIHIADLQRDNDPAFYSATPILEQLTRPFYHSPVTYTDYWNAAEEKKTWLDTTNMDYVPYYDTKVLPNVDDRLRVWGKLADWGDINLYTWVSSDVPPTEWDALAIAEEGDTSISESIRKAGRVKVDLFEKDINDEWVLLQNKYDQFDVLVDGTGAGTNIFSLSNITPTIQVITETISIDNQIIVVGDYSRTIEIGTDLEISGSTFNDGNYLVSEVASDGVTTTITVSTALVDGTDGTIIFYKQANVYLNGSLLSENIDIPSTGMVTVNDLRIQDQVRIVQLKPSDTDFIAAEVEAGTLLQQTQFSVDVEFDDLGIEQNIYHFWVGAKSTRNGRIISPAEAEKTIELIPTAYAIYENVKPSGTVSYGDITSEVPVRFTHGIFRGLRGIINSDFRYVIQFTRDFTLRDSLDTGTSPLQNKELHEQWEVIRREQLSHIPRWLWDRVTESIVGFKLTDPLVRVPSIERELYDTEYSNDTRYGLGRDQAFTSGVLALATIIADLNNLDNDFKPVDINVFFQENNFDTPVDIIKAMDTIYNTFTHIHVNRMFFDTLLDGLSVKSKYADVFKTSMVALHGVRPFQVGGLFDD